MEDLLKQLEKSFIEISELIRESNPSKLEDYIEKYNISGDDVKHADILANAILRDNLSGCSVVRTIASEEETDLIVTSHKDGQYLVSYDPLMDRQILVLILLQVPFLVFINMMNTTI